MKKTASWIIGTILKSLLFAFILMLIFGYIFGFRASLVVGNSSEPKISKYSMVLDYHCSYDELKVGDYITFKTSGGGKVPYTTHQIVYMAPKGEYIEAGTTVRFEHCGMKFERKIGTRCQILTMLTNPTSIAQTKEAYDIWKLEPENQGDDAYYTSGPIPDVVSYSQVLGKVIYSFPKLGKFLFFLRNNFLQIIVYAIIFYVGARFTKYEPDYERV